MEIADRDQFIVTLEGITEAKAGDCIVTGIDNEQWAIKPEWFNTAYDHVSGNTYKRKPQVLSATQIDESEVTNTPNGPIRGDKGDYKVTGTKGEQWYVKPDIFDKTYEEVRKSMSITRLQQVINQVGLDAVKKSLIAPGLHLGSCTIHGAYAYSAATSPVCPLCPTIDANGTTATQVEHYIDLDFSYALGTNPQQKLTHIAEDVRGAHHITPPTIPDTHPHKEIVVPAPKK